jgi:peptidoglycan hydrolase-like protein with peptidoglycan-binding domain
MITATERGASLARWSRQMSPRHLPYALAGSFVFCVGVALNVMVFQTGSMTGSVVTTVSGKSAAEQVGAVPERLRTGTDKVAEKAQDTELARAQKLEAQVVPVRVAGFKPNSAQFNALAQSPDGGPETIHAVQRELLERGYGPVGVDGHLSLVLRAAVVAFENDHGLPLTGEVTDALLKQILLGSVTGSVPARPATSRVQSAPAEQLLQSVRQALTALDYYPGKVRADGRVGEEMERAIRQFELDQGLVPKGRVSSEVVIRLGRLAGNSKLGLQP